MAGNIYKCKISQGCSDFEANSHKSYLLHLRFCHISSSSLPCQLNGCNKVLKSYTSLSSHMVSEHYRKTVPSSNLCETSSVAAITCPLGGCGSQKSSSFKQFIKHVINYHFRDNEQKVRCPFNDCTAEYDIVASFKTHVRRLHPDVSAKNVRGNDIIVADFSPQELPETGNDGPVEDGRHDIYSDMEIDNDDEDGDMFGMSEKEEDLFIKSIANLFNKLSYVKHVPISTMKIIVQEYFGLYNLGRDLMLSKLNSTLKDQSLEDGTIEAIISILRESDPIASAEKLLSTEAKRNTFIEKNFQFISPETVILNPDKDEKKESFQYISIVETLKYLLNDPTYRKQREEDPYEERDGIIKDFRDGASFKNNTYFQENPSALPILLYFDDVEIVNPLGAAKTKYKLTLGYYSLATVQPCYRTQIASIQAFLVSFSKYTKKYGQELILSKLVSDLKCLEVGVNMPVNGHMEMIQAGVGMLCADNLGAHEIAKFSCCFSSSYICRLCDATYEDIQNGDLHSSSRSETNFQPWTKELYETSADKAEDQGKGDKDTNGITGHCVLNQLKSFHCVGQIACCLAHDLLEGVIAHDLHDIFRILVTEGVLTLAELNVKILNYDYSKSEIGDKPKIVTLGRGSNKLTGKACSLLVLIRNLPLILDQILDKLLESDDLNDTKTGLTKVFSD